MHVFWPYLSHTIHKNFGIKLKISKDEEEPKKRKVHLPDQVQMSFLKEIDADFGDLYYTLESNIKDGIDEDKRRVCEDFSFVTTKHQQTKSRLLHSLLSFLPQNEWKHTDFLQPVVIGKKYIAIKPVALVKQIDTKH